MPPAAFTFIVELTGVTSPSVEASRGRSTATSAASRLHPESQRMTFSGAPSDEHRSNHRCHVGVVHGSAPARRFEDAAATGRRLRAHQGLGALRAVPRPRPACSPTARRASYATRIARFPRLAREPVRLEPGRPCDDCRPSMSLAAHFDRQSLTRAYERVRGTAHRPGRSARRAITALTQHDSARRGWKASWFDRRKCNTIPTSASTGSTTST